MAAAQQDLDANTQSGDVPEPQPIAAIDETGNQSPEFLKRLNSKITDLPAGKTYVVGVAIFRRDPMAVTPAPWQLLVVKRAEDEEVFPNNWELPGGHIEPNETVRETVCRETMEETGLDVETVIGEFEQLFWTSKSSGKMNVQYNYAVTVAQPMEIRVNPEEHSEFMWANEDQIDDLLMSPAMNKVLKDSFVFNHKHM